MHKALPKADALNHIVLDKRLQAWWHNTFINLLLCFQAARDVASEAPGAGPGQEADLGSPPPHTEEDFARHAPTKQVRPTAARPSSTTLLVHVGRSVHVQQGIGRSC
jgi:hypothetical protein